MTSPLESGQPWVCGRDGLRPVPLTQSELLGVRSAMNFYKSTDLIARLLVTIEEGVSGE